MSDALGAASPFSYRCTQCSSCCFDKRIQVNPYEIARLARNRGLSTGEFRDRHTHEGALLQRDDGACVFLGPQGCTVHPDRPLVCRLFPLGRVIDSEGGVRFVRFPDPHAARGEFGEDGVVMDYVTAQGALPFIVAADAYFAFFLRASARLEAGAAPEIDGDPLDIDTQLARDCRARQIDEPTDLEERWPQHIALLDTMLGEDNGQ